MIADFRLCDICKKRVDNKRPLFVATDRSMGPAGSSETTGENYDFCQECASEVFRQLVGREDTGYEIGKKIVATVNRLRRKP